MERIHARALETENRVRMIETDGMRLSLYQNMLTNLSTQLALVVSRRLRVEAQPSPLSGGEAPLPPWAKYL